ncbi:UNVERIFIED_CONTAM: Homeobox-leucine zipper protein PROTODERMAL FACTOR 2 [Sesamum radiatum]|uniref:Homeobox-leucine zipper protein PROTODERMAL FACTOR 2 n=1 Tax=Sesamum radiatum TaxID=300843 RepID=A0AAW2LM76_SESRA
MDNAGQDVDSYRAMAIELAVAATEEVIRVAQVGEPLWVPSMDRNATLLNEEEYLRSFSRVFGLRLDGFKCEASRESVVVAMSAPNVIEILMDVEKWSNVFSGVVSGAKNMQLISTGVGENYNEALQLMNAEFHVPSPLVPTRESYFLRYCKQQLADNMWTVVDVSLDRLHSAAPLVACRRRPSGCVIQDMPNGYSKVTWMEHVEVEDGGVHNIYKPHYCGSCIRGKTLARNSSRPFSTPSKS